MFLGHLQLRTVDVQSSDLKQKTVGAGAGRINEGDFSEWHHATCDNDAGQTPQLDVHWTDRNVSIGCPTLSDCKSSLHQTTRVQVLEVAPNDAVPTESSRGGSVLTSDVGTRNAGNVVSHTASPTTHVQDLQRRGERDPMGSFQFLSTSIAKQP